MFIPFQKELDKEIVRNVSQAIEEDLGFTDKETGDITANLIPEAQHANATIITREDCILSGTAWANEVFRQLNPETNIKWLAEDGDSLSQGQKICAIQGNARIILTGERTVLNFLQTLSATATQVSKAVNLLKETSTKLLDTRKTIPGLRYAQKYAVLCGGGVNHRIGLNDAYLIKENHILSCGGIEEAIKKARQLQPNKQVEVEVESLDELHQALNAGADIIMLDNFTLDDVRTAVDITQGIAKLEVSGNITIDRLNELSTLGVDFISSGALTKNIQAIDLSMLFD
jgi:nicotinate-nucleotide pyrophosphorylase (carboxylating)